MSAAAADSVVLFRSVGAKCTAKAIGCVHVPLVCFHAATIDVVPEPYAGIQCPGEDEFAVGREADACHRGVVVVHECAETLTCGSVPNAAGDKLLVCRE